MSQQETQLSSVGIVGPTQKVVKSGVIVGVSPVPDIDAILLNLIGAYFSTVEETSVEDRPIIPGPTGSQGPRGFQGPIGMEGEPGEDGLTLPGTIGKDGVAGATGPSGPPIFVLADDPDDTLIVPGSSGAAGSPGSPGATGPAGPAILFMADDPDEPPMIPGPTGPAGSSSAPAGVLSDLQISVLQSDGTLNAASGVQTWAGTNKTTQDVFTLAANSTYRVRGEWIVNTGATTHTTAIAWSLSSAVVSFFEYLVLLWSGAANAIVTTQSTVHVSGVASKVLNATSTAVYTLIKFEGIMVVTTGGTVTPQINFSANPTGTNLMKAGSWTSFERLGDNTFTLSGGWA